MTNHAYFHVPRCKNKGCLKWRVGNECSYDYHLISVIAAWEANIHDSEFCEVRKQIDLFRLEKLLEE